MKISKSAWMPVCFMGLLSVGAAPASAQKQDPPSGWRAPKVDIGAFAEPSQIIMAALMTESGEAAPSGALEVRGTALVNGLQVADRTVCTAGDLIEYGVLFNTTAQDLTVVLSDGSVVVVPAQDGFFLGLLSWLASTHQILCACRCGGNTIVTFECASPCPANACDWLDGIACEGINSGLHTLTNCGRRGVWRPAPPPIPIRITPDSEQQ